MPMPLSTPADEPGDEGPVSSVSARGTPPTKLRATEDLPGKLWVRRIHAGVDHRDGHSLERRQGEPRP